VTEYALIHDPLAEAHHEIARLRVTVEVYEEQIRAATEQIELLHASLVAARAAAQVIG
jgi:hypothetical protein